VYSEIILTMKKALIVILLLVLVGGYFFAGYSVYTQATLVECAVPEVDQNNRPDNFSLSDKDVFWDRLKFLVVRCTKQQWPYSFSSAWTR
jgi:hypothetical protein